MKINITTWSPDHCKCEIHYQWDGDIPDSERTHTAVESFVDGSGVTRTSKRCLDHQDFADHHEHFAHVLAENQTKNMFLKHLEDTAPNLFEMTQNKQGDNVAVFKKGIEYQYTFEGSGTDRILVPQIIGASLTEKEKSDIIAKMETDTLIGIKKEVKI